MTSEQESHVTPPPMRYQLGRSFNGTFFMLGKAEMGITMERPSCKSTWNLPRLGKDNDLMRGVTFQYPSCVYIVLFLYFYDSYGLAALELLPLM